MKHFIGKVVKAQSYVYNNAEGGHESLDRVVIAKVMHAFYDYEVGYRFIGETMDGLTVYFSEHDLPMPVDVPFVQEHPVMFRVYGTFINYEEAGLIRHYAFGSSSVAGASEYAVDHVRYTTASYEIYREEIGMKPVLMVKITSPSFDEEKKEAGLEVPT